METVMGVGVEVEPSTSNLQPHLAPIKSHAFLRRAHPLLPLSMPSPAYKHRRVVAPHPVTLTRPKTRHCSLQTPGRHPAGRPTRPWMKNQSGCVDASASANELGAEKGDARVSGGLVTGRPPHASLVIARETRNETATAIVSVSGTVLESENETGIGLLDVAVGTAVRAVLEAGAGVEAEVADTVEATATGHWPREWDSNVNNAGTDLHEFTTHSHLWTKANIVYPVRILLFSRCTPL